MSISNDDAKEIIDRLREVSYEPMDARGPTRFLSLSDAIEAVSQQTEGGYNDLSWLE